MRNRDMTRQKILDVVGGVLAENGFRGLGINAVARAAGVDKVLIYRYFGGLPELLAAYAKEGDFWPSRDEVVLAGPGWAGLPSADRAKQMLRRFGEALARRPVTLELMRWELLDRNELTDVLAKHREDLGLEMLAALDAPRDTDVVAIASLLAMAQTYLLLRTKTADSYNGIRLDTLEGQARFSNAMDHLVDLVFGDARRPARDTNKER